MVQRPGGATGGVSTGLSMPPQFRDASMCDEGSSTGGWFVEVHVARAIIGSTRCGSRFE